MLSRYRCALVGVLALVLPIAAEEPKWAIDRAMTVSPAAAPVPALRYRLTYTAPELKAGDAAPIYLRLVHEQSDAARKAWTEKPNAWNELPTDKVPLAEARDFVKGYGAFFQQLDLAATRRDCDWAYTLDQGRAFEILLPDVQTMRAYVPLQVLRARLEIADGDFEAAVRSLRTGIAFSRNVARGPFLINRLVGLADSDRFINRLPEWSERPGSPNLYWALTALPRPLVDLQPAYEIEERGLLLQVPELANLDRERSPAGWAALLRRVRTDVVVLTSGSEVKPPAGAGANDPAEKSPDLAVAAKYLIERAGHTKEAVAGMSPAEVLVRWLSAEHRERAEELFKAAYLEYPASRAESARVEEKLAKSAETESRFLSRLVLPGFSISRDRQHRLDRKIAMLRVVEALRMYAAAHGKLPTKLEDVTEVPVPNDPGTGKPFEFARDGETAVIVSRVPGGPAAQTDLRYRVTLRK